MNDVTASEWIMQRLKPWDPNGARLESFAPEGFEAYARVLHPPGFRPGKRGGPDNSAIRWEDLARARGIDLIPEIGFLEAAGLEPGDDRALDEIGPMSGELPPETCHALSSILRAHTSSPDMTWFCLWEGNGAFWSHSHDPLHADDATAEEVGRHRAAAEAQDRLLESTRRVEALARRYFLLRGPLEAACRFEPSGWYTSPNLWWP
jgi:hypothetical protein